MDTTNKELLESANQKIIPFIWFTDKAEEAVSFYMSVFRNSKTGRVTRYHGASAEASGRPEGSVMTVDFQLEGMRFTAINGEPGYKINPSVSFYVSCRTEGEIDELWSKLSEQGTVLMKLDKYPFNDKYGWVRDKFGVSWQLILSEARAKISPCLMFVGSQQGRAEEAVKLYTDVFKNSRIIMDERYREGQTEVDATVVHAEFLLEEQR
ncbi:MAG TPA: VOC family protein, partial [Bacteroidales bacterium]|nr:VOC family protein [Bacteroidales bacterium]